MRGGLQGLITHCQALDTILIALYPGDKMRLYREDGAEYEYSTDEKFDEKDLKKFLNSSNGGVGAISLKPGGKWAENLRNFLRIL